MTVSESPYQGHGGPSRQRKVQRLAKAGLGAAVLVAQDTPGGSRRPADGADGAVPQWTVAAVSSVLSSSMAWGLGVMKRYA